MNLHRVWSSLPDYAGIHIAPSHRYWQQYYIRSGKFDRYNGLTTPTLSYEKTIYAWPKSDVAIAAIKGIQTTGQIASAFEVHRPKSSMEETSAARLSEVFSDKRRKAHDDNEALIAELYKTIGQRDMELSWLKKISNDWAFRITVVHRPGSCVDFIGRQAELVGVSRMPLLRADGERRRRYVMNALDKYTPPIPSMGPVGCASRLRPTTKIMICATMSAASWRNGFEAIIQENDG